MESILGKRQEAKRGNRNEQRRIGKGLQFMRWGFIWGVWLRYHGCKAKKSPIGRPAQLE